MSPPPSVRRIGKDGVFPALHVIVFCPTPLLLLPSPHSIFCRAHTPPQRRLRCALPGQLDFFKSDARPAVLLLRKGSGQIGVADADIVDVRLSNGNGKVSVAEIDTLISGIQQLGQLSLIGGCLRCTSQELRAIRMAADNAPAFIEVLSLL